MEPGVTHSTWFRRPRSQAASGIGPASLARPICHLGKWSLARGLPLSLPLWHARDPVLGPHERVRVAPSMTAWCPLMLCPHFFHARRSVIRPHMLLRACSRAPEWCGRSGRWDGRLTVALGQTRRMTCPTLPKSPLLSQIPKPAARKPLCFWLIARHGASGQDVPRGANRHSHSHLDRHLPHGHLVLCGREEPVATEMERAHVMAVELDRGRPNEHRAPTFEHALLSGRLLGSRGRR